MKKFPAKGFGGTFLTGVLPYCGIAFFAILCYNKRSTLKNIVVLFGYLDIYMYVRGGRVT